MIPQPLHPAIVHFPVVFATLLPFVAIVSFIAARRGITTTRAWTPTVVLALGLAVSSWVALETGESEEEAVEAAVTESVIHEHEEAAELFFWLSVGTLALSAGGLLSGPAGGALRVITVVAAFAVVFAGYDAGHTGGALVYEHGAASAYVQGSGGTTLRGQEEDRREEHDDKDEEGTGDRS